MFRKNPLFPYKENAQRNLAVADFMSAVDVINTKGTNGFSSAELKNTYLKLLLNILKEDKYAYDLITKMMVICPEKRITAESALLHQWFTFGILSPTPTDSYNMSARFNLDSVYEIVEPKIQLPYKLYERVAMDTVNQLRMFYGLDVGMNSLIDMLANTLYLYLAYDTNTSEIEPYILKNCMNLSAKIFMDKPPYVSGSIDVEIDIINKLGGNIIYGPATLQVKLLNIINGTYEKKYLVDRENDILNIILPTKQPNKIYTSLSDLKFQ